MHGGLSHFKATLQRRNECIRKNNSKTKNGIKNSYSSKSLDFPKASENELNDLKNSIKSKIKKQQRNTLLISCILTLICIVIIYTLLKA